MTRLAAAAGTGPVAKALNSPGLADMSLVRPPGVVLGLASTPERCAQLRPRTYSPYGSFSPIANA